MAKSRYLNPQEWELIVRLFDQCESRRLKGCLTCVEKENCIRVQSKLSEWCATSAGGAGINYGGPDAVHWGDGETSFSPLDTIHDETKYLGV